MGDRCDVWLKIRKCDLPIFDEVFEDESVIDPLDVPWATEIISETKSTCELSIEEANYGLDRELKEAAARGAVFYGQHSAGSEYLEGIFYGRNKKYQWREAPGGEISIPFGRRDHAGTVAAVEEFLNARDLAVKEVDGI